MTEVKQAISVAETWEDSVLQRYPTVGQTAVKEEEAFRNYDSNVRDTVRGFYEENHTKQTLEFVLKKKAEYYPLRHESMTIQEAFDYLNSVIDDSDPDTNLSQFFHALQTAEGLRRDGHPRWLILTGLIHDLGKILCKFGEPQWCVVGDTFPVGCAFSKKIVYPEFFERNPDSKDAKLSTPLGIYEPNCGLDNVHLSFGHDEYLAEVVKSYLPAEAVYIIRYHSFYSMHRESEYRHLMNAHDHEMLKWVLVFNPYDLYTKTFDANIDYEEVKQFYDDLIREFFPGPLMW